jgi:hypothetical protein
MKDSLKILDRGMVLDPDIASRAAKALVGKVRQRTWKNLNGVEYVDYTCGYCMTVIPDLARGCHHCFATAARDRHKAERFKEFLNEKQAEQDVADHLTADAIETRKGELGL